MEKFTLTLVHREESTDWSTELPWLLDRAVKTTIVEVAKKAPIALGDMIIGLRASHSNIISGDSKGLLISIEKEMFLVDFGEYTDLSTRYLYIDHKPCDPNFYLDLYQETKFLKVLSIKYSYSTRIFKPNKVHKKNEKGDK